MLEEVVADASMPVDAEADAEDAADFRRFLESVSPAELVRHLNKAQPEPKSPGSNGGADDQPDNHGEGPDDTPGDTAGDPAG
jgi:hypothetical protein